MKKHVSGVAAFSCVAVPGVSIFLTIGKACCVVAILFG